MDHEMSAGGQGLMQGPMVNRILNQLGEGAAFGALIGLILWMPHLF
jgi:hypothetical protein